MDRNHIDRLCHALINRYKTNNPFEIADALGICVEYDRISRLKGYYCCMNRVRMIVINSDLDERLRRLVCAHELGHDRLHYKLAAVSPLRDEGFNSQAKTEIEANRFAAGLLVLDDDFIELTSYGYTDEQIAMALNTFPEIARIKTKSLCETGLQFRLPDMPKSTFMKTLK